ncbi:MAG: permease-like cell division protein FtsX [Sedimenticola sp.]
MSRWKSRKSANTKRRQRYRLDIWVLRHLQVFFSSLGRLSRSPLSTLMTSAVIGIALALPAGLYLLLNNIQTLSGSWEGAAGISLFLEQQITDDNAARMASKLRLEPAIKRVTVITKEEALTEFRDLSGFAGALDALDENPLPGVLIIEPESESTTPEAAEALVEQLKKLPGVAFAQLDLQWVRRFHAITEIAQRGVLVLASLLGLAVLLIVGNTIRLEIQNRHAEIEITKLIGGTDAFIRRPFLYNGLWYGLFGGIIAWIMVALSVGLLDSPVARLAGLYHSGFDLSGMDFTTLLTLIAGSTLLGLAGSWIAVGRHLSEIEPS